MSQEELPAPYTIRRATVEDLAELKTLWESNRLAVEDLEKRFTEFQVAIDAWGQIAGAIGLHISKNQGLIHGESYKDLSLAVELRPLFWNRLLSVAKNHGLLRLWTVPSASFYREQGMTEIDDSLRAQIPEGFGSPLADWAVLKLKDETPPTLSLEKEFEFFAAAQKEASERMIRQAAALKLVAYLILVFALAGAAFLAVFAFKRAPRRNR
jgi:N-acetylglutamate synthase-like GNAT family acetyltransferase